MPPRSPPARPVDNPGAGLDIGGMTYRVSLNKPGGERWAGIEVPAGRTILETALGQGIDYPHGCRSGNCGGCKSHLIEGEVEMAPHSPFALTEEERGRGLILACRSVPWSDCTVAPIEDEEAAVHASRRLACRVAAIGRATHDIRILSLDIESGGPFDFTARQYAALAFEGLPARDFSMASRPGAERLEFHIRLVAGGQVTRHVLDTLRIGDPVSVTGPMGTAHYRANHRGPILLVAGGSGIAPIKSIADTALAGGARQDMFLYFGARAERDVYLEEHFAGACRASSQSAYRHGAVRARPAEPTGVPAGLPTHSRRISATSTGSRPISPARRSWWRAAPNACSRSASRAGTATPMRSILRPRRRVLERSEERRARDERISPNRERRGLSERP